MAGMGPYWRLHVEELNIASIDNFSVEHCGIEQKLSVFHFENRFSCEFVERKRRLVYITSCETSKQLLPSSRYSSHIEE